ncbi:MAG: AbrB/MazE/SpoVT family DNA-binding domain-containing protein [Chloroflexota bacterium]|nr:MAG: AbrB/MazE/SpoVT family DNA-binding domain-containing protein [Chloroflexota bacterium]
MASAVVEAVQVDAEGRVTVPKHALQHLGIEPGDILALVKVVNAFDVLAVEAIALDSRGDTISVSELIERLGLDPGAEPLEIIDDPD